MIAGRELDALVAEKVMGLEVFTDRDGPFVVDREKYASVLINYEFPHYSTDIAATWEVVDRMGLSGFTLRQEGIGWNAGFRLPGKGKAPYIDAEGQARADTAPLAICLAALKAVGAEVPA